MPEPDPQHRTGPPRTRKWKRIAVIVLLLVVGGAVVNVAVAWGLAYHGEPRESRLSRPSESSRTSDADRFWMLCNEWGTGWRRLTWEPRTEGTTPRQKLWNLAPPTENVPAWSGVAWTHEPNDLASIIIEDARGWPLLSWRSISIIETNAAAFSIVLRTDGIDLEQDADGHLLSVLAAVLPPSFRVLPVYPLWYGFIINTLFYAMVLWLFVMAPFAARRLLRRRRGLCETCAYPIGTWGGSPVCTECGAAVKATEIHS